MSNRKSSDVVEALGQLSSPSKAQTSSWFFKTGVGQYGHGDVFIGVTVPEERRIARAFRNLGLTELSKLLASPIHEHRLTALLILVLQYQSADQITRGRLVTFYLSKKNRTNNWDLVDSSAKYILGEYLCEVQGNQIAKPVVTTQILYDMAMSHNIWHRRIAIVATHAFIARGEYQDTLKLAEILMSDTHDLIHKAVGWMLREVGKCSPATLRAFLDVHAYHMPRTMLRYAIEKFDAKERTCYLKKNDFTT